MIQKKGVIAVAKMKWIMSTTCFVAFITAFFLEGYGSEAISRDQKIYVGSDACKDCHESEYDNFQKYARKAHSYKSIDKMRKRLTDAEFQSCFECHTTGYGKPGGFRSDQETPHVKDAGCEVCHGPGSLHVETEDSKDIKGNLTSKDCEACHNAERVAAFDYKPLVFGGAH
jgi:hypothetical protein